jgi:hypothetical protein
MDGHGKPTRVGEVFRQAGAVATAVKAGDGLRWQVRRERDGLIRIAPQLAHTSHWRKG